MYYLVVWLWSSRISGDVVSFLGKSLRIAARLRALSPGMSITVQAHAGDTDDAAPPSELGRTRIWLRLLDGWKEITRFWQRLEKFPELRADAQPRGVTIWSEFLAMVDKQPILPVEILRS